MKAKLCLSIERVRDCRFHACVVSFTPFPRISPIELFHQETRRGQTLPHVGFRDNVDVGFRNIGCAEVTFYRRRPFSRARCRCRKCRRTRRARRQKCTECSCAQHDGVSHDRLVSGARKRNGTLNGRPNFTSRHCRREAGILASTRSASGGNGSAILWPIPWPNRTLSADSSDRSPRDRL